ncbi:MAG: amidohydrolase family protein [Chitinophagaceae bacterium]|nr:amidohydrolase family protein [Chitinophagaceae bacterium]
MPSRLLFMIAPMLSFASSTAQETDTIIYSVIMAGQVKGFHKTWKQPDGSYRQAYQYNDRGRGDSTVTDYRLDASGFITRLDMKGVDYMKSPVHEQFENSGGKARWENNAEKSAATVSSPAYYMGLKTNAGPFPETLLRQGGKLSLLPVGTAEGRIIHRGEFSAGDKTLTLSLLSISGLSLTPVYTWVDEEQKEFAQVSDWFTTIRQGYESFAPRLLAVQKEKDLAFYEGLSTTLRKKPAGGGLCIRDIALFDATTGKITPRATVWVEGRNISAVHIGTAPATPSGWQVIDGRGKTLLPGLWDMHTHMSDNTEGILHLAAGVTSIRDMGNGDELQKRIADIASGRLIGPDEAVVSGFIDGAGPYAAPTGAQIKTLEEGIAHIRRYDSLGFRQIKLYSSIRPEWVKPMVDEAHKRGMRVCGHIPAYMTATQAIEAGYNEVTHMNMLVLNFYGDTIDTRSTGRFTIPAQRAASLDLDGEAMRSFIALLKKNRIVVDPTLSVFETLFTARDGVPDAVFKPVVSRFPAQLRRNLQAGGGGLPVPDGMDATYRASFTAMLGILKKLYDNGITIVAGTDGFAGFTLHRELELYVQAGIPPAEVLKLATLGAATVAGQQDVRGSITKGKIADMVVVEGDPARQISDIRKTVLVVRDGYLYDVKSLYEALSISK